MSNLKNILKTKKVCKSIWFMRQAGRYLPEFRKIRSKNKNFINLCLNSELSSEITLQPIKRFDVDSAIIFSDILMVPYALGQNITFTKQYGPKLKEFNLKSFLNNNELQFSKKLGPIYKAIEITRKKLDKKKSLISFIGAPWTLLIYMLDLKNDKQVLNLKKMQGKKIIINNILNELVNYLCIHIKNQINAGADVIQIFDSWAGLLQKKDLGELCFIPNKRIIEYCRKKEIQNICFPKGLKKEYKNFCKIVKPDGINLDYDINPLWAKKNLKDIVLQGGLNPNLLLNSEAVKFKEATKYT